MLVVIGCMPLGVVKMRHLATTRGGPRAVQHPQAKFAVPKHPSEKVEARLCRFMLKLHVVVFCQD